ncbi:TetR/AcrR family transcriptional regulator [Rhodococcus sp. B50]|uniref:TetR/AcrR family transcriptional regulator n=1 Tax=Rhodococcus sp. B50 TaxID=2682847 RepID=UPI0019E96569|nr:TetR/AcrR family transcriptional regulator [Rhodococcus sp. B50]MBS9372302.1 hypothetical protein [Rhodococcus sp. B50]
MTDRVTREADRRRRRPTKTGVTLDEKMIVDTALRMLEQHGPAGLSTRRLGRALGADHTALYRYFRGMDDLELALTDELINRVTENWHPTGDWKADLYRWGLSAHAVYMQYPQAAMISATRISGRPAELAAVDRILGLLRNAGFSDRHTVMYYECFTTQMLSYAAWDGARKLMPGRNQEADIRRWQNIYARVSPDHYPNIAATAQHIAQLGARNAYPLALRILIAGMQATLEHPGTSPTTVTGRSK